MTIELSKYELLLIIKAIQTAQVNIEDEQAAFTLANRLIRLTQ